MTKRAAEAVRAPFRRTLALVESLPDSELKREAIEELRGIGAEWFRLQVQASYGRGIAVEKVKKIWRPHEVPRGRR